MRPQRGCDPQIEALAPVTREILLKSKLDLATSWLKTLYAFQPVLRIKATFYVALQKDLAAGYFSGSISTHSLPL